MLQQNQTYIPHSPPSLNINNNILQTKQTYNITTLQQNNKTYHDQQLMIKSQDINNNNSNNNNNIEINTNSIPNNHNMNNIDIKLDNNNNDVIFSVKCQSKTNPIIQKQFDKQEQINIQNVPPQITINQSTNNNNNNNKNTVTNTNANTNTNTNTNINIDIDTNTNININNNTVTNTNTNTAIVNNTLPPKYICCQIQQRKALKFIFNFTQIQKQTTSQNNNNTNTNTNTNNKNVLNQKIIIQTSSSVSITNKHQQQLISSSISHSQSYTNHNSNFNSHTNSNSKNIKQSLLLFKSQKQQQQHEQNNSSNISDISSNLSDIQQLYQNLKQSNLYKFPQLIDNQYQLYQQYRKNIQKLLNTKLQIQIKCGDYPQISYTLYKRILTIWQKLQFKQKNKKIGIDQFIKYGDLLRLAYGNWLNDVIISAYVKLIKSKMNKYNNKNGNVNGNANINRNVNKQNKQNKYVIFDSLKTINIFDNKDNKSIQRIIQKNKVIKYQTNLILIINLQKHWYFIVIQPKIPKLNKNNNKNNKQRNNQKKQQQQYVTLITIYDSLPKTSTQFYIKQKLIQQIIKFIKYYYQYKVQIRISQNYPIQKNKYDCGVMTLCGIKDVVREYLTWSFDQNDMMYKRVLITKQLVDCEVYGF